MTPIQNYTGKSWSVYNPNSKMWQQTWVDDKGRYISLTGGMTDGKMILNTPERTTPSGKMQSRMIFYNISANSFDWDWQSSTDEGAAWKSNWKIHYKRKH